LNANAADLKGYVCPKCGWADLLKTRYCPQCHIEMQEMRFAGRGRIFTFTVVRYPPRCFEGESPYVVALIDMEDGPRVIGRVIDPSELLEIGKTVSFSRENRGMLEFRF